MERWLPIPGLKGAYEVSDAGRVRSVDRVDRSGRFRRGVVLKTRQRAEGYRAFNAWDGSVARTLNVHRVVLLAFVGEPPHPNSLALHSDGNPANNALSNLRWGTGSENQADSVRHGTHGLARRTHCGQGHPYDELNTRTYATRRVCRACDKARQRAWRARRAEGGA